MGMGEGPDCDVSLAYPTLPSMVRKQHQDGVAHLVFTKEETHCGLFF